MAKKSKAKKKPGKKKKAAPAKKKKTLKVAKKVTKKKAKKAAAKRKVPEGAGPDDARGRLRTGPVLATSVRLGNGWRQRRWGLRAQAFAWRRGAAGSCRGVRFVRSAALRIASCTQHQ